MKLMFKLVLFISLGFFLIIHNYQVMAMEDLFHEEIQEITETDLEENEEIINNINKINIMTKQKFVSFHEIGHAVIAFELSKRSKEYPGLIKLKKIKLKQDDEKIDGSTDFSFDRNNLFGHLFALSVYYGGLEAEKIITTSIEEIKSRGQHDEKDIEKTAQYIIERGWFLGDLYLSTDSLEIRKDKIKNIAQTKTKEIIQQYQEFLSPLADELLKREVIEIKEFQKLLKDLIVQKKLSQKPKKPEIIEQSNYNHTKSKCDCVIL
ncbi:MAG: SVM family protein [Pigeon pea little leaf phytoplasma]|nr:SVM family protein ['Bituminaria bituminosa' little leaf phytoplasma]MDV3148972.1 SVM family protein [Pigeon pea little leaf phytoplasma]MDV3158834.1 SVM family protein [Pigeon pea little leaf phytoplasma]MDV3161697.1 SVM family protein [Pigeon pea little leaf phytoplasma]MDV3163561.1 SVM family protein [Pigeon pea little leaf phytoplasma]MDV3189186.1 SVM family protein [Pigeon pea little leaf phytoplasma]